MKWDRIIVTVLGVILWFVLGTTNYLVAEQQAAPIKLDAAGCWSIPLRYWAHRNPFDDASNILFLGEVTTLGKEIPDSNRKELPLRFRTGGVKVLELLHSPSSIKKELSRVRTLKVEGTEGLRIGDRVVVMVCTESYEGLYVIDYHNGNCILGVRLFNESEMDFDDAQQKAFIDLLRKKGGICTTTDEMRLWLPYDSRGLAEALIHRQEREK